MKVPKIATLLTIWLSTCASAAPLQAQNVLAEISTAKVKVPGHNHAYYTQVEKNEQLFNVRELVVYPNPPAFNEHLIIYLDGWLGPKDVPGLEDTVLKVSGLCPDYYEFESTLSETKRFAVRYEGEYGSTMMAGDAENELFLDFRMLHWPNPKTKTWIAHLKP